jgi:hypothetical protein
LPEGAHKPDAYAEQNAYGCFGGSIADLCQGSKMGRVRGPCQRNLKAEPQTALGQIERHDLKADVIREMTRPDHLHYYTTSEILKDWRRLIRISLCKEI